MNFDKESKSEEKNPFFFFFFGGGGGGGGGEREGGREREEEGDSNRNKENTKNNRYSLIFCAHALYKISSSWLKCFFRFNTNKRNYGQIRGITDR